MTGREREAEERILLRAIWVSQLSSTRRQFFLEYILEHPAATCAFPATGKTKHLIDNMAAGLCRLLDAATRAYAEIHGRRSRRLSKPLCSRSPAQKNAAPKGGMISKTDKGGS